MQPTKPKNATKRKTSNNRPSRKPPVNTNVTVNKAPVSKNVRTKKPSPKITSVGSDIVVTNKEYIGDVTAANSSFAANNYNVNPGLSGTFPWLSAIANRYESYLFTDLRFVYEPICATTVPGSVMMAVDYDASDGSPTNKVSLMSYKGATRTAPWDRTDYNARNSDLRKFGVQRYVRSTAVTGDIKTFDVGNFFIATQNTPATPTTLGELYVQYTVRLYTPQFNAGVMALNAPATEAASQWTSIKIPAGTALPTLTAEYRGSGASPLAWLNPNSGSAIQPTMFLNLNALQNFMLSITTSAPEWPGGGDPLRFFNNLLFDGQLNQPGFSTNIKQLDKGFASRNIKGEFARTFLVQPKWNAPGGAIGGGIFPINLVRLDTEYTINMAIIPVQANYTGNAYKPATNGLEWAFPEVAIPMWSNAIQRNDGSHQFSDDINVIIKTGPADEGLEPEGPITRSKSKSRFNW
nr:MAG: hypothetical protein 2 [Heilongjiang sediment noda-like virus 1]